MKSPNAKRLKEILELKAKGERVVVMVDDNWFFKVGTGEWEDMGGPEEVLNDILANLGIKVDSV